METLRSDLKKISLGSAELVSRAKTLQAPSWKFPEKLAVALDLEGILKDGLKPEENSHVFLLELVIDRLLLVMQCCVLELEGVRGHRSANIPFTLGSAVKRLTKCILRNTTHSLELKEKLSSKSKQIDSLESSVTELQQILQSSSSVSSAAKFSTTVPGGSSVEQDELVTSASESNTRIAETAEICTQTTETAFMLCTHCSTTQSTLVNSANLVSSVCKAYNLKSRFAIYDWDAIVKKGGIEIIKWYDSFRVDMSALDENAGFLLTKLDSLTTEKDKLEKQVAHLQEKIVSLDMNTKALKDLLTRSDLALNESRKSFATDMANVHTTRLELKAKNAEIQQELDASQEEVKTLTAAMKDLEVSHYQMEADLLVMESRERELKAAKESLEEQLDSVIKQSQEALNDSQVELNKVTVYNHSLEKKYKSMKTKQTSLLAQLDTLDEECGTLRAKLSEVSTNRENLATNLKQVQEQYELVQQLFTEEKGKLTEANNLQYKLESQLSTLKGNLASTKDQVEKEKQNCRLLMDFPFVKQTEENYASHVSSLVRSQQSRKQISANTIRILLLEEQNNELRKKTNEEARELKGLAPIPPMVTRPLPLWERELVSAIHQKQESIGSAPWQQHQSSPPLIHSSGIRHHLEPIQGVVKKSRSTDSPGSACGEMDMLGGQRKNQSAGGGRSNLKERLQSGDAKFKGHLGHLAAAVAESHRKTSPSNEQSSGIPKDNLVVPVDIEVHSCKNCDRMFCQQEELTHHYLTCDKMS